MEKRKGTGDIKNEGVGEKKVEWKGVRGPWECGNLRRKKDPGFEKQPPSLFHPLQGLDKFWSCL